MTNGSVHSNLFLNDCVLLDQLMNRNLTCKKDFLYPEQKEYVNSIFPSTSYFKDECVNYFTNLNEFENYKQAFNFFKNSFNSEEEYLEAIELVHSVHCETCVEAPIVHILFINH